MFAPCINSIKTLFIIPTDAHNYKIIGMLKTIKILTVTPTCFGSRRNHRQGATSCLAKTIVMALLCSSLERSNDEHNRAITIVLAKHLIAP